MQRPTLYMLAGYPGSGKTTTAQMIQSLTGAARLSSDELRIALFPSPRYTQDEHDELYRALNEHTECLLAEGRDVIYDANLNRHEHRIEKYELAERVGARTVLIWIDAPKRLARERAVLRGHRHLVPEDETFESMFDRVAATIQEPRADEPHLVLDGRHVDMPMVEHLLRTIADDKLA